MNQYADTLSQEPQILAVKVRNGERQALARAITFVESTRADHQAYAATLLQALLPYSGKALRIGISGAPGVGKSTLIEALGLHLLEQGQRLAILTIDPSSTRSGGAILGDKTRMEKLAASPDVFIRPSAAGQAIDGVAKHTREAMLVCEAAGFDIVIVETVGVGQSQTAVANMTDCFVLLQLAHSGDGLQAIKKGIIECADVIVYNKMDIDRLATQQAMASTRQALKLLRPTSAHWQVPVLSADALHNQGIAALWQTIVAYKKALTSHGELEKKRQQQALAWLSTLIAQSLHNDFYNHTEVAKIFVAIKNQVASGHITAIQGARHLLQAWQQKNI